MMSLSTNVSSNPDEVLELLCNARSIKGTPIPRNLIAKCTDLCLQSDYNFVIPTGTALSRKKCFFLVHKDELVFYNQDGIEFNFSEEAREIIHNEVFIAVHYDDEINEANIYAYFPYDGAMR